MIMCVWSGGWMVDTCSESEREESNQKVRCDGWQSNQGNNGTDGSGLTKEGRGTQTRSNLSCGNRVLRAALGHRHKGPRLGAKAKATKKRTTYKTSKRILLLAPLLRHAMPRNICEAQKNTKTVRESRPEKKRNHHETSQKEDKTRNGAKKSKKQEEGKPKKFQFIQNSLNKYNIRYGVFMYIIHFQRNAHSTNGLWCEKSLWGFKAPHGAHCIDCTMFPNGSTVRANKWEPKKIAQNRAKKKKNKKNTSEVGGKN